VLDRGGDRSKLYLPLLERGLRFIVRLIGERHLTVRGHSRSARDLARGVKLRYAETVVRESSGGEKKVHLQYGFRTVKLPRYPQRSLTLVVVSGFGQKPLLLLTNLEVKATRRSLWRVVQGYLSRWLVEETIRFIKQSYQLEDLRVLHYERLRNLAALVMASAYFAAAWLGHSLKLAVLASRVMKSARRFFGRTGFHYYALADGIGFVLSRSHLCRPKVDSPGMLSQLFSASPKIGESPTNAISLDKIQLATNSPLDSAKRSANTGHYESQGIQLGLARLLFPPGRLPARETINWLWARSLLSKSWRRSSSVFYPHRRVVCAADRRSAGRGGGRLGRRR
jgi:hypothetical protein